MNRTSSRLLSLLSLLQARRDWSGAALAERLDVTPRTVRRDADRLRELGYPVQASRGPHGGYRLAAGSELPPLLFDVEQAVALAVALRVAAASGTAIQEAAARALVTVRQVMPTQLRHRVDALQVTSVLDRPGSEAADPEVLIAVTAAIHAGEVLRFDYQVPQAGHGAPTRPFIPPRRVEPHHALHRAGRWYLVAWDLDRADWRIFRIDRITPRIPTGPRFVPRQLPGGDIATFVNARFKGSTSTDTWPCYGEVELNLPAAEVIPFALDAVVETQGADRCRITLGGWSWIGVAASLARFDADLHVIGPPQLREACAVLAQRFADSVRG